MPSVAALCFAVLAFFSVSMVVPAAAALINRDWISLEAIAVVGIAYGSVSMLAGMALRPRIRRLNRAGVFTASAAMWFTLVLAGVPLFLILEGAHPVAAVFDSISAAVTLGLTFHPIANVSEAMAFYRGIIAWQGGLLTLLLAVYVLGRYEVGGTSKRHLRFVLHSFQADDPRVLQTFAEVFVPYVSATLVCAALLVLVRVAPGDAFSVALSLISTNGFVHLQSGASVLNNLAGEAIMIVFMIYGSTSILWHRSMLTGRWLQVGEQMESVFYLGAMAIVAVIAILFASATPSLVGGPLEIGFNRAFDIVSTMTTTGITHDQRFGLGLPFELVIGLALVGGCAYSTSGGLKMFRFGLMLHHSGNEVQRLVYPHAMMVRSVDANPAELTRAKAVWSAFFLTLMALVVAIILFSVQGIPLDRSIGAAVGAFSSTANLLQSSIMPEAGVAPSAGTLALSAVVALFARIEFVVVLAAFGRNNW